MAETAMSVITDRLSVTLQTETPITFSTNNNISMSTPKVKHYNSSIHLGPTIDRHPILLFRTPKIQDTKVILIATATTRTPRVRKILKVLLLGTKAKMW